jgi:HSP20 family molecular chaperone IbpA
MYLDQFAPTSIFERRGNSHNCFIIETEDRYRLELEFPGFKKVNLKFSLSVDI